MKSLVYTVVALGFAASGLSGAGAWADDGFLWPLPVEPRAITGTFMEFREGRLHSGMDLRTGGREGLPVVAPEAGSIVRLRTSPTGYGVAVYLQLDDGRMLVFAHLSALSDRLRQPILRAWKRTGRYQQYLYLKPGELRVERGELLALSGSTGVGAPHLHLEVRDAAERPLNPQLNGFAVPDTIAPRITAIRVVPLGAGAQVEGERAARNFEPGASFSAAGTLGVMVRIDDRTGYSPFRVGPLGVAVELDGHEVYRLENDTFAFSQTGQMRLEKFVDPENPKRSWLRLYRRPGNELPQRAEAGPPGATFVAREAEEHRLTIRAWDVNGHRGDASFTIAGSAPLPIPDSPEPVVLPNGEVLTHDDPWRYHLEGGPGFPPERPMTDAGTEFRLSTHPNLAWSEAFAIAHSEWRISRNSFYPGGGIWSDNRESMGEGPEGTTDLKPGYVRLRGSGAVFRDGVEVEVRTRSRDLHGAGLFLYDDEGEWSFLAPMSEEEGTWVATVDRFGMVALARDTTPPELGPFRVGKRLLADGETLRPLTREQREGVTYPDWPSVRIDLKDLAAGIPDDGLETLLDGEPWPARWEPEDEVLVWEWWLDPGEGEHQLTVKARDGLGNASESSIRLSFRR